MQYLQFWKLTAWKLVDQLKITAAQRQQNGLWCQQTSNKSIWSFFSPSEIYIEMSTNSIRNLLEILQFQLFKKSISAFQEIYLKYSNFSFSREKLDLYMAPWVLVYIFQILQILQILEILQFQLFKREVRFIYGTCHRGPGLRLCNKTTESLEN